LLTPHSLLLTALRRAARRGPVKRVGADSKRPGGRARVSRSDGAVSRRGTGEGNCGPACNSAVHSDRRSRSAHVIVTGQHAVHYDKSKGSTSRSSGKGSAERLPALVVIHQRNEDALGGSWSAPRAFEARGPVERSTEDKALVVRGELIGFGV